MDKFIFAFISIRHTFVKSCLCARPDEIFIRSGTQRKGRRTQSRSRSPESKSTLTSSGVRKSESRQGVSQGISQGVSQLVSTLSRRHGNKIFIRYCRALLFDIINKSHESVNTTLRGRATSDAGKVVCLTAAAAGDASPAIVVGVAVVDAVLLTYLSHKVLSRSLTHTLASHVSPTRLLTRARVGVPNLTPFYARS